MLKLYDFRCEECDHEWEDLVDNEKSTCEQCNKEVPRLTLCSGNLGSFSLRSPEGKRQELLRRSAEHTLGLVRQNPEKFGDEGIRRAREGQIRSVGGIPKD